MPGLSQPECKIIGSEIVLPLRFDAGTGIAGPGFDAAGPARLHPAVSLINIAGVPVPGLGSRKQLVAHRWVLPMRLAANIVIAWLSRESSSMRTVGATSLQREVAEASQQAVMPSMRDLMMMDDQRMRLKWSRRRHGCGLVYPFQPSIRMRARYNRGLRGLGRRGLRPSPGVMVRDSARKSSMPEMIRSRQGEAVLARPPYGAGAGLVPVISLSRSVLCMPRSANGVVRRTRWRLCTDLCVVLYGLTAAPADHLESH